MPTAEITTDPTALASDVAAPRLALGGAAINYRDGIIYGIAGLLGIDPRDVDSDNVSVANWVTRIHAWLRKGLAYWPWKQFQITEERAFRQAWFDDTAYPLDAELYHEASSRYYRVVEPTEPGEEPGESDKFELITELERYIPLNTPGRRAIGQVVSVQLSKGSSYFIPFAVTGRGVELLGTAGPSTVWLTYQVPVPQFTAEQYDPEKEYQRFDLAYDPESGECYRAPEDGQGQLLSASKRWVLEEFPAFLAEYVINGVASDLAEDAPSKALFRDAAEEAIVSEVVQQQKQGDHVNYLTRRRLRRYGWDLDPTL